jgi:hypothetical protein
MNKARHYLSRRECEKWSALKGWRLKDSDIDSAQERKLSLACSLFTGQRYAWRCAVDAARRINTEKFFVGFGFLAAL